MVSAERTTEEIEWVKASLSFVPPLILSSLLSDASFARQYGVDGSPLIAFGNNEVVVERSKLFTVVREVLASGETGQLVDRENQTWEVYVDADGGEDGKLLLKLGEQRLDIDEFKVLAPDPNVRKRFLDGRASDLNLPPDALKKWRDILVKRGLEDGEFELFDSEFRDTPAFFEWAVGQQIEVGSSSVTSLVPRSKRYYERLVGAYDRSNSVQEFADSTGKRLFEQLNHWRPREGFLHSLYLSSHSALTQEISLDGLSLAELKEIYEHLELHGDMLSRLGAIEVGLRELKNIPDLEPALLGLIRRVRDDNADGEASEFRLFSCLFILVDGELARTRLFVNEPPFYRRLASLAHAALIHRQLMRFQVHKQPLCNWALQTRGKSFYIQSLADMRLEPRWSPDFSSAPQLQYEFIGRIMITGQPYANGMAAGDLRSMIRIDSEFCLVKSDQFPMQYIPGPLEGAEHHGHNPLPDTFAKAIEDQLSCDDLAANSFTCLVNSALIFSIPAAYADLASRALKLSKYMLSNLESETQLVTVLKGLATVAAGSRTPTLTEELRILIRRYRRDPQCRISIGAAFQIALIASAAHKNLTDWCSCIGDWLTESKRSFQDVVDLLHVMQRS